MTTTYGKRHNQQHNLPEILSELSYPAEKWQITTCAEIYGADIDARRQLYGLPARSYESVEHILDALPEEPQPEA
jgi:hypothetical protein